MVVETVEDSGAAEEDAAAYLEIPHERVSMAMRYYRDHQAEIDAWIASNQAIAERHTGV